MKARRALNDWISQHSTQAALAQKLKCSEPHLSLLLRGERGASFGLAKKIEVITGGAITADALLSEKSRRREAAA